VDSSPKAPAEGNDSASNRIGSEGYVTLKTFASIVDVTYPTALGMVKSKRVLAVQVGGRWRIFESEVNRFLREGNHPDYDPDWNWPNQIAKRQRR
jgi:excisionase family DNA binding protein